jgi:hypothetical protein
MSIISVSRDQKRNQGTKMGDIIVVEAMGVGEITQRERV